MRVALRRLLGWAWMDPVVGLIGALVIAAWGYTLIRHAGSVLLDMNQYRGMAERMRAMIESDGDRLTDLHLWRLGPGHLAAILSVATKRQRGPDYYRTLLRRFRFLSHVTVQVQQRRLPSLAVALPTPWMGGGTAISWYPSKAIRDGGQNAADGIRQRPTR